MPHPIRRTRQFIADHPVVTHSLVAVAAFGFGARCMGDVWKEVITDELGPEMFEKLNQTMTTE